MQAQYVFNLVLSLMVLKLYDQIRKIQGKEILEIINKFLKKYPKIKFKKQVGKSNFNKKKSCKR